MKNREEKITNDELDKLLNDLEQIWSYVQYIEDPVSVERLKPKYINVRNMIKSKYKDCKIIETAKEEIK